MTDRARVLLLPGWLDSGPAHWQSRWEALHGFERVRQSDWQWPLRGDWMAQLEEAVLAAPGPVLLAAHSLGCHLVAAWAAHSGHAGRALGALLVAPPDLDRADAPPPVARWRPAVRRPLPFPALLVHSDDDPFCSADAARALAADWGAASESLGARGHLNAESGLGDWPEGVARLRALVAPR
jgi:predicted alpha/beta hydrolase family esterase